VLSRQYECSLITLYTRMCHQSRNPLDTLYCSWLFIPAREKNRSISLFCSSVVHWYLYILIIVFYNYITYILFIIIPNCIVWYLVFTILSYNIIPKACQRGVGALFICLYRVQKKNLSINMNTCIRNIILCYLQCQWRNYTCVCVCVCVCVLGGGGCLMTFF